MTNEQYTKAIGPLSRIEGELDGAASVMDQADRDTLQKHIRELAERTMWVREYLMDEWLEDRE